jgi:hypothetical protein
MSAEEQSEQEKDEEFELIITIVVIVAALFLGYKNRAKLSKKIKELVDGLK